MPDDPDSIASATGSIHRPVDLEGSDLTVLKVIHAEPAGSGIIDLLEAALDQARAGELSSIAIATVDREGCVNRGWSKPPSFVLLLGAVARLQYAMNEHWE